LTKRFQKTIKQYYENVNRSTLSKELVEVLGKLVDNHEHLRDISKQEAVTDNVVVLYWDEDSFKKWVTTNQPLSVISTLIPTLWRVFLYFAGFPFTEPIFNDSERLAPQHHASSFVRAYSLLASRRSNCEERPKTISTPSGDVEKSWSQQSPRFAPLMFDSLKILSMELEQRSQGLINANLTERVEEQLRTSWTITILVNPST
jgi:hypothetical protein